MGSSFLLTMSHPFRVQFRGDVYPGRRALWALALGWYVLRFQRFCRFAAREAGRLVSRLRGHVTLRTTSPQHGREMG
jgi:hypothetical protein